MTPTEKRRVLEHRLAEFVGLTDDTLRTLEDLSEQLRRAGLHDARDHLAAARWSIRAAGSSANYARAAAKRAGNE